MPSVQKNSTVSASQKPRAVQKLLDLIPQSSVDSGSNSDKIKEQMRRFSTDPQEYRDGSGVLTEPGSPAKPGKLLGKPFCAHILWERAILFRLLLFGFSWQTSADSTTLFRPCIRKDHQKLVRTTEVGVSGLERTSDARNMSLERDYQSIHCNLFVDVNQ